MPRFSVTYDIVTPESAEHGDVAEAGFIGEDLGLREAIDAVRSTRTSRVGGVECVEPSCSTIEDSAWITITNGMEYETGAVESRSLHLRSSVTDASRRRIARLMGVRGA